MIDRPGDLVLGCGRVLDDAPVVGKGGRVTVTVGGRLDVAIRGGRKRGRDAVDRLRLPEAGRVIEVGAGRKGAAARRRHRL